MEKKILDFLTSWKDGILNISQTHNDKGDYKKEALKFIKNHYLFETENVLFKPTLTKKTLFRNDLDSALSYFIGGTLPEDSGFALKPWKSIKISETNNLIEDNLIVVMGVFDFITHDTNEIIQVAFTFFLKTIEGNLKIKIHHSSTI